MRFWKGLQRRVCSTRRYARETKQEFHQEHHKFRPRCALRPVFIDAADADCRMRCSAAQSRSRRRQRCCRLERPKRGTRCRRGTWEGRKPVILPRYSYLIWLASLTYAILLLRLCPLSSFSCIQSVLRRNLWIGSVSKSHTLTARRKWTMGLLQGNCVAVA